MNFATFGWIFHVWYLEIPSICWSICAFLLFFFVFFSQKFLCLILQLAHQTLDLQHSFDCAFIQNLMSHISVPNYQWCSLLALIAWRLLINHLSILNNSSLSFWWDGFMMAFSPTAKYKICRSLLHSNMHHLMEVDEWTYEFSLLFFKSVHNQLINGILSFATLDLLYLWWLMCCS